MLSLEEYTKRVGRFLEHLDPKIYVERLFALSSHRDELIAPEWSKERWATHNAMRRWFAENGVRQGARLS